MFLRSGYFIKDRKHTAGAPLVHVGEFANKAGRVTAVHQVKIEVVTDVRRAVVEGS